jgi:hypothetical protein
MIYGRDGSAFAAAAIAIAQAVVSAVRHVIIGVIKSSFPQS